MSPFKIQVLVGAFILFILGSVMLTGSMAERSAATLRNPAKGLVNTAQFLGEIGRDDTGSSLLRPLAVAVDPNSHQVYVTDTGRDRVLVFKTSGQYLRSMGHILDYPNALAVDKEGRVYIGEFRAGRIQVFEQDGSLLYVWDSEHVGTSLSPLALAVKGESLYIANRTGEVLRMGLDGKLQFKFGSPGNLPGNLAYPNGIAVRGDSIIVADSGNARLQIFNLQGELVKVISQQQFEVSVPRGISVDDKGSIYIADTMGNRVLKLNEYYRPQWELGQDGLEGDKLSFPNGLAVAGNRLYVTDRENGRVVVYALPES